MRRSSARILVHAVLLASCGCASIAAAQSYSIPEPPTRSTTDANGIDLAKGQFAITETDLSIGPQGAGGLAHTRFWSADTHGGGWRHGYLLAVSNRVNGLTINLGDHSVTFTGSGSNYASDQADGSTLTANGNLYIYTARDGTIVTFDQSIIATNATYYGPVIAVATSIVKPNGEKLTLTYYQDGYDRPIPGDTIFVPVARLVAVNSTIGYQLFYSYASDNPTATDDWYRITQVSAVSGAFDYCDPTTANTCTSGAKVTYGITTSGNTTLESVTDPAGRTRVYTTDTSTRRMLSVQRPSGSSLTFGYGSDNRVATVSNGTASWSYAWSLSGTTLTGTVTQPLARQRTVTANTTTGNVLADTDGLSRTTTRVYDSYGRPSAVTAPEGNAIVYAYDDRGNMIQQTAVAKGGSGSGSIVSSAIYDPTCYNQKTCNQPNSTTDARGNVTAYTYDPNHGGVLTVTAPQSASGVSPQTRFGYTPLSAYYKINGTLAAGPPIYKLTSTSTCQTAASCAGTADEVRSSFSYGPVDSPNALVLTAVSKGSGDGALVATTTMAYDYANNLIAVDGPLPGSADTTFYSYNADRQITQVTGPDPDGSGPLSSHAVQYSYNLDGQVTGVAVGTGNGGFAALQQQSSVYDGLGRKVQDSTSAGTTYSVTQYSYDAANRLDCSTVRMNADAFGSLPSACAASSAGNYGSDQITRYSYDNADQVTTVTTGYGTPQARSEMTSSYTLNGKVQTLQDANGNVTTYGYDGFDRLSTTTYPADASGAVSSEGLTYDASSNITQQRLRDGSAIGYSYDALGRVINKTPGSDNPVGYTYDNFGHLIATSRADLGSSSISYDALGRLTSDAQPFGATASQYDAAGRRIRLTWNDGFFVTYDYDAVGEMTAIHDMNGNVLAAFSYDDLGRRTGLSRGNGTSTGYGYDAVSHLTALTHTLAQSVFNLSLSLGNYSPAGQLGNRTSSNTGYAFTGKYNVDRSYAVNGLNQYTASGAVMPVYDGRGNLTGAADTIYTYTAENQLKAVSGAASATLYYDALQRLAEYDTTVATRFVYDGPNIVAEIANPSGAVLQRYIYGPGSDEPLVWYQGADANVPVWLHADERGSVIALSDSSGNGLASNAYDEYGIPQSSNYGRFQYTGQAWLPEIGLYNYKARTYSPTLGRFLQPDPIGYGDGLNPYNYVRSDPVNHIDFYGLEYGDVGDPIIASCCTSAPIGSSDLPPSVSAGGGPTGFGRRGLSVAVIRLPSLQIQNNANQKKTSNQCLVEAGKKNGAALAVDGLSLGASFLPGGKAAVALGGLALGTVSMTNSALHADVAGIGIAAVGYHISAAGPLAEQAGISALTSAGKTVASLLPVIGTVVAGAALAYDGYNTYEDYKACMESVGN